MSTILISDPNLKYLYDNCNLRKDCQITVDENYELTYFSCQYGRTNKDPNGNWIRLEWLDDDGKPKIKYLEHSTIRSIGDRYLIFGKRYSQSEWEAHPLVLRSKIKMLLNRK